MPDADAFDLLRCPRTRERLARSDGALKSEDGRFSYPIVRGIPVLIADERSLFHAADFTADGAESSTSTESRMLRIARAIGRMPPRLDFNLAAAQNCARMLETLRG